MTYKISLIEMKTFETWLGKEGDKQLCTCRYFGYCFCQELP